MAIRNAIEDLKQKGRIEDAGPSTNDQGRKAESFRAVKEEKAKRKKLVGINSTRVTPAGYNKYRHEHKRKLFI